MREFTLLAVMALSMTPVLAQTNIISCSTSFIDIGGESNQYINNESSDWLICPEDAEKYLSLEFTYVDIETANDSGIDGSGCRDMLYIYDGMDDTAPLVGNFCGQASTNGDTSYVSSNTLHIGDSFTPNNLEGCFFIRFESDGTNTRNGWNALVECCEPTLPIYMSDGVNCPKSINDGVVFDFEVDLGCIRSGGITNFTDFTFDESIPQCVIDAESKAYKSYYKFTANSNGGFTELNVNPIDNLGEMTVYAIGPLKGTCPEYVGGYIADCQSATDPSSMFFNMTPYSSYMIVVATEQVGKFRLFNENTSVSLPVEMLSYSVDKKGHDVLINWETAIEVNNAGFELYRSYDNKEYTLVSKIQPTDKIEATNAYSYLDTKVVQASDIAYYFLRQIDLDGRSTDYEVKTVEFELESKISVYPNPASNHLYIDDSNNTEEVKVRIYDTMGSTIYQRQISLPNTIDVSDIPMGVYTVVIESNTSIQTIRQVLN